MSQLSDPSRMNTFIDATNFADDRRSPHTLRWWPLAVLLIALFSLRYLFRLFEAPNLPVMMVSFMGPAVCGLLILGWWLFASRATLREKASGLVVVVSVAVLSVFMLHPSMKGMGAMLNTVPNGLAAFGIPLLLLAAVPRYRLPFALICSSLTFVYWDFIQMKGVTGTFVSQFDWRWTPTSEQRYLESIAAKLPDTSEVISDRNDTITLVSAAWPNFRGSNRDSHQPGIVLETDWIKAPPKCLWQSKIGPGWSSFAVAGERLFTQEQRGENEAVVCLNANSGSIIWLYEYPSRFWEAIAGAGPRATPTIADEGLFALGGNGILVCLHPASGKLIWQADLQKDADRRPPEWGFAASPLVVEGVVIVHAGGKDDKGVLAYDAVTGLKKWSAASGDHSYSSPQFAKFGDVTGVLMQTNTGLQFLDPTTGTQRWQYDWPVKNYRALQPHVVGNQIIIASTLGQGVRCIEVKQSGDEWKFDVSWSSRDLKPDFNDFVVHEGFVYGFDNNIFTCLDFKTGKRKWKNGRYGNGQVLLLPDEDQLFISTESGEIVLVKASSEEFVELAKAPAIEGKTWNHPVVVGNRAYIRNSEQVACFTLETKSTP